MNEIVINTRGLTRYYGGRPVVDSLDLSIARGSVYGFLGRNGAGKSTTIRMLLGLVEPTRGSSTVFGESSLNLSPVTRGRIGYISEEHTVYSWMTVRRAGKFQKAFYPRWNQTIFDGIVKHFRLDLKALGKNLSRGQRAGLCLAMTLATEPELLILDDPTIGLDVVARRSLLESMIYVTRGEGRTILFSSHAMADIERVAEHVCVLHEGTLRANCSIDAFRESITKVVLTFDGLAPAVSNLPGVLQSARSNHELSLIVVNFDDSTEVALRQLGHRHIEFISLTLEEACAAYLGARGEENFFMPHSTQEALG